MSPPTHDEVLSLGTASPSSTMSEFIIEEPTQSTTVINEPITQDPVASATVADVAADPVVRHKTYFIENSHIQLRAGDTVFRIYAHFFTRESDEARALVARAELAEDSTLILQDVTADDLERFCDILYCGCAETVTIRTQAEWTSVLHLAHRWNFAKIRAMAIAQLAALAGPVDRVILAHAYDVGHWLPLAYQALCERETCLSDEEGLKLGIHDVLKIARLRVAMRPREVTLDGPARAVLLQHAFKSVEESHIAVDDAATTTSNEDKVVDTPLVVPAATIPSAVEDVVLPSLRSRLFLEIKAAVASALAAHNHALVIHSVFEPLVASIRAEVAEAERVPATSRTHPNYTSYMIAQNCTLTGHRQISMYVNQMKTADEKLDQAKAQVATLVSRASW